jgi:hypothetical protein
MKKILILLCMLTVYPTNIIYSMDNNPNPAPNADLGNNAAANPAPNQQDDYFKTKAAYYRSKQDLNKEAQKFQENLHSAQQLAKKEVIEQTVQLGARQVDKVLSLAIDELRKNCVGLTETEILEREIQILEKQMKEESLEGQKISNEAAKASQETKTLEKTVYEKQQLIYEIDAVEKLASHVPGGYKNPEVQRRLIELANQTGMNFSEEKKEDQKPQAQPEAPKAEKISLSSKLTAPFIFALTTATHLTDYLANNSFAHITRLDCFKDTFIEAHNQNLNRALVIATLAAIIYGYKLYNDDKNEDNEDIFDNDLEY